MKSLAIDQADNVLAAIRRAAALDHNAEALVGSGRRLTYDHLLIELSRVWTCLRQSGVSDGDIVALRTPNGLDAALWTFGTMTYGALILPISPHLADAEAQTLMEHAPAKLLVSAEPWAGDHPRRLCIGRYATCPPTEFEPETHAEDDCILVYTSGTSGAPKGIRLTQANILDNVHAIVSALGMRPGHRTACVLPQFHLFGIVSDIATMLLGGGCAVITPEFELARVPKLAHTLVRERVRSFSGVPLLYEALATLPCDLTGHHLEFCVSGAAPLRPEVAQAFESRHGVSLVPGYGLSETTCYAALNPPECVKFGSIGKPLPFNEMIVVDEQDRPVGPGIHGEILIRGANVMNQTYHRRDDEVFSPRNPEFLRTGDIGYQDDEGYFFVCGRRRSMVIRGGDKVYLEDVDKFISRLPEVAEVTSVRADRGHQEMIVSFVVPASDTNVDATALRAAARKLLGVRRCPDRVVLIDALPRTSTHKPRIGVLTERASRLFADEAIAREVAS